MNKSWLIYLIIAFIAFISGCVGLPSGDEGGALFVNEACKDLYSQDQGRLYSEDACEYVRQHLR